MVPARQRPASAVEWPDGAALAIAPWPPLAWTALWWPSRREHTVAAAGDDERQQEDAILDADEIERGIGEIAQLATEQGVHVALIGGAALQLLGSDRLSRDIDFAADRLLDGLAEQGSLKFGAIKATTSSGMPAKLVVRDDKYRALYEAAVEHASRVECVPVFVVRGEYLIAMKMVAGRPKDDAYLEFLIAEGGVDLERAKTVVSEHLGPYAVDELERVLR